MYRYITNSTVTVQGFVAARAHCPSMRLARTMIQHGYTLHTLCARTKDRNSRPIGQLKNRHSVSHCDREIGLGQQVMQLSPLHAAKKFALEDL